MDKLAYMQLDRIEQKLDIIMGSMGINIEEPQEGVKDGSNNKN